MKYKLIEQPNLPEGKVAHCLIGKNNTNEIQELSKIGIKCFELKANPDLCSEISGHADMSAFNCGKGEILTAINIESEKGEWPEFPTELFSFKTIAQKICSPYPNDVALNATLLQDKLLCNAGYVAEEILEFAKYNNTSVIHSKQGYARCSMCVVAKNAIITEDKGIARLLKKHQFDVLVVESGDVALSEKHSGFLGGASAKLSKNTIYFSGNLIQHKNYTEIISFLEKYNIEPIFNRKRRLTDFGGIIQLTEYLY